jgi:small subunit ribosomal protein S1
MGWVKQDLALSSTGDFLTADHDYRRPHRGELRESTILSIEPHRIIVDIGAKSEGIVPHEGLERLGKEAVSEMEVGDRVPVYILGPYTADGSMIVSLYQARLEKDWLRAQELFDNGELWEGQVTEYNRGGLIVPFGEIRGFLPISHIEGFPRRPTPTRRMAELAKMVGQRVRLKVIEVDRSHRRLILSEREAQKQWREEQKEKLINELWEGQLWHGRVSKLCDFGAFVDLGGADGLIHISELSWGWVNHPSEVVQVGDEVDVYVLRLDYERKRIGLSLKRLHPDPWARVHERYEIGHLVEGTVISVHDFGAFVRIKEGIDGLLHVSEMRNPPPQDAREIVKEGDKLLLRIISIDGRRHRMGLSLRNIPEDDVAKKSEESQIPRKGDMEAVPLERYDALSDKGFWASFVKEEVRNDK